MSQEIRRSDQRDVLDLDTGLEALRQSSTFRGPVEPVDDHEHAKDHFALIYEDRDEQFAAAVPFVRQGLDADERCMYIADDNSRAAVLEAMADRGIDVDAAVESGALSVHTKRDTYCRGGEFDPDDMIAFLRDAIEDAEEEGYEAFRVAGEMTWIFGDDPDIEDLVEYEGKLNDLLPDENSIALCQYNRERFPAAVIRDVIRTHPHLIYDNAVSQNFYYTPPEEFFGPREPEREIDRMLGTLRERTEAKSELQRHKQYLRRLHQTTADTDLSFDEKVERLLELGCERFDLRGGALSHLPSWEGDFRAEVTVGPEMPDEPGAFPVQPDDSCFCRRAIRRDEATAVPDIVQRGWDDDTVYEEIGLRTYFGISVTAGSEPYGTLWFYDTEPRDESFTDDERTFLELMGQWISDELERTERNRAQRQLYDITADSDLPFDEKVERLLDLGRDRFGLDIGFFSERCEDEFRVVKARGVDLDEETTTICPNSDQYCERTVTVDRPVGVTDTAAAGWDDDPLYRDHGLDCYLGTRVTDGTGVFGTVCFADTASRNRDFTDAEYTFLDLLGQWLSYELERENREAELQESKDQFERIFRNNHDAIYINDPHGDELIEVNPAGCEMLGYSREEILSRGPSDFHPDEMDRFQAFVDEVYERGCGWTDELTCLHRNGDRIPVEISASRIEYDGRQCMLAMVRDISERKEREARLQRKNDRLESFASLLAHELRNPVTIGQIYSQQLPDDEAPESVEYVTEAFDRIEEMIDVMLVLTRGREAVGERTPVDLADVAREAWGEVESPDATLDVELDRTIQADETYVRHLLRNLLENAVEHGSAGSETQSHDAVEHGGDDVTVTVGDLPSGFYVADDGPGIPEADRDEVFEAGYTTASDNGGTGLGLAFVAELAEVYEWDCSVTESEAGGARFEFRGVDRDS